MSTPDISSLIEAIYAAAENADGWREFLQLLTRYVDFDMAAVHVYDREKRAGAVSLDLGLDAAARASYDTYYSKRNPWMRDERSLVPGSVSSSDEILPYSEYRRSEFCSDFGIPNRVEHSLGCNLSTRAKTAAYLSLNRSAAAGPFTAEEKQKMAALMPHLQRAVRIGEGLAVLEALDGALRDSAAASFRLDAKLRILELNPEGERLLQSGRLLVTKNGSLAVRETNQEAFARLANGSTDTERLIDSTGEEHVVKAVPVSGKRLWPGDFGVRMVMIVRRSVEAHARHLSAQAGSRFALTQAETRLVEVLVASRTLSEAAATIGISPNTAKTHLARILRKTGTANQRQLVQLVSSFQAL
jgi:DNA-binding CsgD family transcriptional regulator